MLYLGKNLCVCIDGGLKIFWSQSKFIMKIKEKNPQCGWLYCVIHREAPSSGTLPVTMKDSLQQSLEPLTTLKQVLSIKTLQGHGFQTRGSVFHMFFRWLSKPNMLTRAYEIKDELILFF